MYRALLAQLIDSRFDPKAAEASVEYALSSRQGGQPRGSPSFIRDLFFILLGRTSKFYVIVDAIDECEPSDRYEEHDQALREELQILYDGVVNSGAKLVILSRPSVWGLSNLSTNLPMESLNITSALLLEDLARYCQNGLYDLCGSGYLPPMGAASLTELCNTLLMGADGMFLWMRLMFSYLRSPVLAPPHLASRVRLQAIRNLRYPESLDQIYCRILGLFGEMPVQKRHMARQVFKWLLFSKDLNLGASELHTILTATFCFETGNSTSLLQSNELSQEMIDQDFTPFSETILLACSSLVELSTTGSTRYYRFVHATTSEFFLSRLYIPVLSGMNYIQPSVREYFQLCKSETEMELGSACLRYLLHVVPARPLSGSILESANRHDVSKQYRFASYASAYWTAHFKDAGPYRLCGHSSFENSTATLVQAARQFLESQLNVNSWVELLYLLGNSDTIGIQHENLRLSVPLTAEQEGYPVPRRTFMSH
ncbi:hypothetical protein PG991_010573 [Apiospora marii]|uniref:NACHT domain-containing protein n=1 Tax=Apiospora marii TaxID=335849 RepID=A0ABR1RBN0_9PEZI